MTFINSCTAELNPDNACGSRGDGLFAIQINVDVMYVSKSRVLASRQPLTHSQLQFDCGNVIGGDSGDGFPRSLARRRQC